MIFLSSEFIHEKTKSFGSLLCFWLYCCAFDPILMLYFLFYLLISVLLEVKYYIALISYSPVKSFETIAVNYKWFVWGFKHLESKAYVIVLFFELLSFALD